MTILKNRWSTQFWVIWAWFPQFWVIAQIWGFTQIWGIPDGFTQIWVIGVVNAWATISGVWFKNHLLSPKHSQRNICGCRQHSHNWRSYTGSNSLFVLLHNKRVAVSKLQVGISSLQARKSINELGHVHVIFRFYRRRRLSQSFRRLSGI